MGVGSRGHRGIKRRIPISLIVLAMVTCGGCGSKGASSVESQAGAAFSGDPCRLASVAEVRTLYAKVGRAKARTTNECDYYPASGPWANVSYLAIQVIGSEGQNARAFVATGAPPTALIGLIPGIGDSAAYQLAPATTKVIHLPANLAALAAVKGNRVAIVTFMGPLSDFPGQAPGEAGFTKATALLSKVVATV